jgi:hypothetical protein
MQQPLPPAPSSQLHNPPPATTAQPDPVPTLPDLARPYRGWYPRWWLLSAFLCGLLIGGSELTSKFICTGQTDQTVFCQFDTWTDPGRQTLVVLCIWLLFLTSWLLAHLLGVGTIEIYKFQRGPIASIFASISEFGPIYILTVIYGVLAFCYIVVIWYLGQYFNALAFSFASILVFVAISCFLYRQTPTERRTLVLGIGVIGICCIIMMFVFKRIQVTILVAEITSVVVCGVIFFRRRPLTAQPTPEEALAYAQANTITPAGVFTSLIHSWQRNSQATANNANQNPAQAAVPNQNPNPTQPLSNQATQPSP